MQMNKFFDTKKRLSVAFIVTKFAWAFTVIRKFHFLKNHNFSIIFSLFFFGMAWKIHYENFANRYCWKILFLGNKNDSSCTILA
ncbi:unnamed protein product [Blepharisma stoltei]|uniref:Uncharacterized protein n=1 Tax=Blepharisma stoltei TaxID=1481888 RepID=A0AAU9J3W3_9CILI|nr:unnamed protein product [Blepharisma stoltei]